MFEDGLLGTTPHIWDGFSEPRQEQEFGFFFFFSFSTTLSRSRVAQAGPLSHRRYVEQVLLGGNAEKRGVFGSAFCLRWKNHNEPADTAIKLTVFKVWYSAGKRSRVKKRWKKSFKFKSFSLFKRAKGKSGCVATKSCSVTHVKRSIDRLLSLLC